MSDQSESYTADAGGAATVTQLPPPPPPPAMGKGNSAPAGAAKKGWRPSKKLVIIGTAAILIVVAAIVALVVVKNLLRGGAESPEQAGEKLITAVNNKDVTGIFAMVAPHERDSVIRLQKVVTDKFKAYAIAGAIKKVAPESSEAADGTDLVFDGVDVSVSGATPSVTPLAGDFAQVLFSAGEVHAVIHPELTKGPLHSALAAAGQKDAIESQFFIADLGPHKSGLSLIAGKTDGRWYLSPMLSALEMGNMWSRDGDGAVTRGQVPASFQGGSDSPDAAAGAAVRDAVSAVNTGNPLALTSALVKDESAALYMYSGLWSSTGLSSGAPQVTLGDSSFTTGPQDGNRALAFAKNISLGVSGDHVTLTDTCLTDPSGERKCLNGSGYALNYSSPTVNPFALFAVNGKYGLTTVKEDGKWKVSVLDTATDMAIGWVNSLTKQQALAVLQLARADTPSGTLTVGKAEDVAFNSAGYAVRTLTIDKAQKVVFSGDNSDISAQLYSEDAKTLQERKYDDTSSGSYYDLAPGTYVAVVFAARDWQDKFEKDGNDVKLSTNVMTVGYTAPPRIEGSASDYSGRLYTDDTKSLAISMPDGTTKNLALTVTDSYGLSGKNIDVEVSGKHYAIPTKSGTGQAIPFPADAKDLTVNMKLDSSGTSFGFISYELGFQN